MEEDEILNHHGETARRLFKQGYNCAQAVVLAFCDEIGLDKDTALRISASYGGGMGRLREVCGAVTGMFIVAGAKYGYTDPKDRDAKAEHYRLIQSLATKFKEKNDSYICRELRGLGTGADSPVPEVRTKAYYQARSCDNLVACAAEILDELFEGKDRVNDMVKIAVASEKTAVTEHFGHCENFNIFETENGQIVKSESIPNPGHKPGFLPNFLNDLGVKVIISGGMGGGAVDIFNEKGIEVILGARGNAETAVKSYLQGELKSTGSICHEHQHHGECEN